VNIIFLCIDTLRYDCIRAHGLKDAIETPNFDRLLARSWVFDHAYCASFPTIPHRTDVITGQYGGPFHQWRPLPFHVPTLPEALARLGYCTQLIHDSPHLVNGGHAFDYPFHAWTQVRGAEVDRPWIAGDAPMPENWKFDPLFDGIQSPTDDRWRQGNLRTYLYANRHRRTLDDWNCARLFRTAAEFLSENAQRRNFFLWIDCFDPHEPWDAPPRFMLKYDRTPGYDGTIDPRSFQFRSAGIPAPASRRIACQYAAKVSWVDHCFGAFLDAFESTGLDRNTAIILTADHGTNDGRDGCFGKALPIGESVGHVPFVVYAPGRGSGRASMLVQPQDVWATVMGLAGGAPRAGLDSHNVLGLAQEGARGPRDVVLAGQPPNQWNRDAILFSVFDGEWCLQFAARPETCRLLRLPGKDDVAPDHPDVVERLWRQGVDELERRGCDPKIMAWLRSHGTARWPQDCRYHDHWPPPAGYVAYFQRLYRGDE
jgi:arylsulfatase A-like enzyme